MFESFQFISIFSDFFQKFSTENVIFLVLALRNDGRKCLERGGRSDPREPSVEANPDAPQRQCGLVHAKFTGLSWRSCQ